MRLHLKSRIAMWSAVFGTGVVTSLSGCGPVVDCNALCDRTLACEVTFDAPDDPDGTKLNDGTRSSEDACFLGCEAHPVVTVESAACVDELDTRDASVCQETVLACFEIADDE